MLEVAAGAPAEIYAYRKELVRAGERPPHCLPVLVVGHVT